MVLFVKKILKINKVQFNNVFRFLHLFQFKMEIMDKYISITNKPFKIEKGVTCCNSINIFIY